MSEYGDYEAPDDPLDALEERYYENPAATGMAVAQLAGKQEAERIRASIVAEASRVASERNSQTLAIEVERDLLSRIPDFDKYRAQVTARLEADPALLAGAEHDPAAVARRIEDQYRLAKADAQRTTDEQEWRRVQRAAVENAPYWDERRRLLDIPRSQGGLADD